MTDQNPQETPPIDEETLQSLQQALYPRLRDHLVSEVGGRLLREAAEQPVPLYFDRFVGSEIQRLEEAVEHNGRRIEELREEMDQRFAEAKEDRDRRFAEAKDERAQLRAEMDRRFVEAKEEREQLRTDMNRRFERMDQRFDQLTVSMRNWALAAVAIITVTVTILNLLLQRISIP